jgi:hypothetical protein
MKKILFFVGLMACATSGYGAEVPSGDIAAIFTEKVREAFNKAFQKRDLLMMSEIITPLQDEDTLYLISQSDMFEGETLLYVAIQDGYDIAMIRFLLEACPNGSLWDYMKATNLYTGDNCLHCAAKKNDRRLYYTLQRRCPSKNRREFANMKNEEGKIARNYFPQEECCLKGSRKRKRGE